jgi:hypothetical protein
MADQGMIVRKKGDSEQTDRDQESPFRFLDLPWDIRRTIYDKVSEQYLRYFPGVEGFAYAVGSPPVSLLKVNRQISSEATSALADGCSDQPPVIFYSPWKTYQPMETLGLFLRTLSLACQYDKIYLRTVPKGQNPELKLDKWALKIPLANFKRSMAHTYDRDLPAPNIDADTFHNFLTRVLLQMRRKQILELRILLRNEYEGRGSLLSITGTKECVREYVGNIVKPQWREIILAPLHYRVVVVSEDAVAQAHLKQHPKWNRLSGLVEWDVATPADRKVMDFST